MDRGVVGQIADNHASERVAPNDFGEQSLPGGPE